MRIIDDDLNYDENSFDGKKLLFTESDFENADDLLTKMLIRIMLDKNVTHKDFVMLHKEYMMRTGASTNQINYGRNNLLKPLLHKSNYSYRLFNTVVRDILGVNPIMMSCSLMDVDGKIESYSVEGMTYHDSQKRNKQKD